MLLLLACHNTPSLPPLPIEMPATFPAERWTAILQQRVDREGRVDYRGLQQDRKSLDEFRAILANISPENHPEIFPTADDRLAYWLNAYNVGAIAGVVSRPGLTSVNANKLVLADFFYNTPSWYGGFSYSLAHVENEIVRPFGDPRVHFALNCDSVGCPRLPQEAFEGARLQAQLQAATVEFVSNPKNVKVEDGKIWLSQIFEWYAKDFVGGVIPFINRHGASLPSDLPVAYLPYDWSLISQPGRGP